MASLYDQIRKPWAAWEMTMEGHDPTNNRVLDFSGNGRHLTLGDGAGSNEPTKLVQKRGYRPTAVTDKLTQDATTQWTSGFITVETLFRASNTGSADIIELWGAGGVGFIFYLFGGALRFYSGGVAGANNASMPIAGQAGNSPIIHAVGRYDGVNTSIFINGQKGTDAGVPLPPNTSNPAEPLRIFSRYDNSEQFNGDAYLCRIWDVALTDVQIRELSRRAKQELTRI